MLVAQLGKTIEGGFGQRQTRLEETLLMIPGRVFAIIFIRLNSKMVRKFIDIYQWISIAFQIWLVWNGDLFEILRKNWVV